VRPFGGYAATDEFLGVIADPAADDQRRRAARDGWRSTHETNAGCAASEAPHRLEVFARVRIQLLEADRVLASFADKPTP
jgi:hypothetical protein